MHANPLADVPLVCEFLRHLPLEFLRVVPAEEEIPNVCCADVLEPVRADPGVAQLCAHAGLRADVEMASIRHFDHESWQCPVEYADPPQIRVLGEEPLGGGGRSRWCSQTSRSLCSEGEGGRVRRRASRVRAHACVDPSAITPQSALVNTAGPGDGAGGARCAGGGRRTGRRHRDWRSSRWAVARCAWSRAPGGPATQRRSATSTTRTSHCLPGVAATRPSGSRRGEVSLHAGRPRLNQPGAPVREGSAISCRGRGSRRRVRGRYGGGGIPRGRRGSGGSDRPDLPGS